MSTEQIDSLHQSSAILPEQKNESEPSLFQNRSFLFIWFSAIFTAFASSMYMLTEAFYVTNELKMDAFMGVVLIATALPRVLLMTIGGVIADRFKKSRIMVISDFSRAILLMGMVICFISGWLSPYVLLGFAIIFGILDAFYWPANQSIIPTVVPTNQLAQANAIVALTQQAGIIIGPVLGAFLLGTGYPIAFSVIGAFCFIGAILLYFIKEPKKASLENLTETSEKTSIKAEIMEGLTYVIKEPFIRSMMVAIFIAGIFISGPLSLFLTIYNKNVLGGKAITLGYLEGAIGIGLFIGGIIVGILQLKKKRGLIALSCLSASGLLLVALGSVDQLLLALGVVFGTGIIVTFCNTYFVTLLQERTPPEKIGRVMSLVTTASMGFSPVSLAIFSALIGYGISVSYLLQFSGMAIFLSCLVILLSTKVIRSTD